MESDGGGYACSGLETEHAKELNQANHLLGVDSKLLFLYGADGKCVDQRPASKMKQD